ncbi:MAG: hypothetical protein ABTQ25_10520 [Nitrosomonas ureae]|jgi:hypothetical protein
MSEKATQEVLKIMSLSEADQKSYFEALPPDKTSTLLVNDLEKKPQSKARDEMIARAMAFGYDDFRFTMLYDDCVCPKIKLLVDAEAAGFHDIAYNNKQGKYD